MRILLVHLFGHRVGGIEVHLQHLLPALRDAGHDVALLHEHPAGPGGPPLAPAPSATPQWCLASEGVAAALASVERWRPDVVYAHQLVTPAALHRLQAGWPSLFFAHCYVGACISTRRAWRWPRPQICQRTLGWGCLLHYYPHRCGGLNPVVMWRLFREQREARDAVVRFGRLVTHSDHVLDVYRRHGFPAARAEKIPFWVPLPAGARGIAKTLPLEGPVRILFLGRFDVAKGGALLLEALPTVARRLGRPVELALAGDGPQRAQWERAAVHTAAADRRITVTFPGWLDADGRDAALAQAHVLAAPSVWPEPFGMSGIEAGGHGVPAVAFRVGGIPEWLRDGVNGVLTQGASLDAGGLADAFVRCLADPQQFALLSRGAVDATRRFEAGPHLAAVEGQLRRCVQEWRPTRP